MTIDKYSAWLCLKSAPELSTKSTFELLKSYPDPLDFVGNPQHELYTQGILKPATSQYLSQAKLPDNVAKITDLMHSKQIAYVCYGDAEYPLQLKNIFNPPLVLYYRGNLQESLQNVCLAVVGTRKPSAYGIEMCRKILSPLCDKGCTIISGLAMGIDTAAHQTALSANSHTIAVLASGVESIYPPMNQPMAEKIIKKGALLSEYEPGTKMERWNFPARNRIISALAQGVFIVECPLNSGALLTAKFATEQSREIFALPGNINNRNAQGPNSLIRDGAMLISCPEDLVQHLGFSREVREQMELIPELNNEEQVIYDLMGKQQKDVSFDEFLLHTGFSFGKLSIVLLNLELKGIIAKSSGNSFIRI